MSQQNIFVVNDEHRQVIGAADLNGKDYSRVKSY
jgi:hypothetical protein